MMLLPRHVYRLEQFARLPVWPIWNGIGLWLLSQIAGTTIAAYWEDQITGRVGPNFYKYNETSPYIMLVHHCHSFSIVDPFRFLQRIVFPEGFPAHPHRGFVTITYFIDGGFVHRDSMGVRQTYGRIGESSHNQYNGKHTQWLITGKGLLHEEMFDLAPGMENNKMMVNSRQELFQIWLNVPAKNKMDTPRSLLLGGDDETPLVVIKNETTHEIISQTLVLAGTYQQKTSVAPLSSDLVLFHVTLQPSTIWEYTIPNSFATAFFYVRKGSLNCPSIVGSDETITIPAHYTSYLDVTGEIVRLQAGTDGADFMFLAGAPIDEPCVASGSMVMTSHREIEEAYRDYQNGYFGQPWDHKLPDSEWKDHVATNQKQIL